MFYGMRRAGRALTKMASSTSRPPSPPGCATSCSPARRPRPYAGAARTAGRIYDAVVLDAPPTGRIARFLNVNSGGRRAGEGRPDQEPRRLVHGVLHSPETAVHFVTLLEEMPVQETLDGIAELRAAGLPAGGDLHQHGPRIAPSDRPHLTVGCRGPVRRRRARARAQGGRSRRRRLARVAEALAEEVAEHARRTELERRERASLAQATLPSYELPLLADGVDLGGLYELAEAIRTQGAA